VLDLPAAGVFLAGPDGEQLTPAAYSDEVAALFDGDVPSYGQDSPVWPVFESGDHRVIPDARETPDVETVDPIRSLLLLPLGDHGVLISSAPECREFSEAEVDLARLLAANTEAALDDAVNRAALRERERALRTERDRLSALFENVPIPALRVDHRDGEPIVQEVNAAFEETFGYDAAAIVGENVDDFVMPDRRDVEPSVKEEVAAGRTVTREVRRATADGLRDFLLTTAPVDPGTTDGQAYGFYIDITERRQRQQRLRVLSRVLRHDIRNRMNVIDGNAELVRERASEAAVADPATRIQRAADELLSLSHRTRRLDRTVAEAPDASPRPLSTVIDSVVAAAADRYPAASIAAEQPPDAAVHSADAVEVALTELIENAVEHADAASPTVSVRASTDPDGVTVEVSDDGPGVPEPERALVEGTREPTQLEHASGIGLWMVKWVATALGGEVRIEDREPRGTTVSLWLPCVAAD
jgi:PAS domain S-box-containing protein